MDASASIYSGFVLRLYDFVVLTFSNYWLWCCPTGSVLLPFFRKHLGESAHLDIGVGSGYYPAAAAHALARVKNITLLDLNPSALAYAAQRLRSAGYTGEVVRVEHNVFNPIPKALRGTFDAVSLFYVFHCLPGALPDKARKVFASVSPALAPGGVIYGATILGKGVQHNAGGSALMELYNKKGIFGNREDSIEGLQTALNDSFEEVEVRQIGVVALFEARRPRAFPDQK